jgi:polysaccharide export outer membrane protein
MIFYKAINRLLEPAACTESRCRCYSQAWLLGLIFVALAAGEGHFTARAGDTAPADTGTSNLVINAEVTPPAVVSTPATNSSISSLIDNMDVLDDKHKLVAGDKITFRVVEDEDDPKSLMVNDDGDVQVPYIGIFPARGKTCKQLAQDLKVALEKKYYYHATVIIGVDLQFTQGIVYLVGAVAKPGPEEIPREEVLTVGKAILRAGGFTDYADQKHVRVTRGSDDGSNDKVVFTVDVAQIFEKGKTENDRTLEPGDLIYVPERVIRF